MDEFRPAAADHIHIFRIKFHRAVDAVRLFENRLDRQSGRFLRRMHIFPRVVPLDVPDRRLTAVAEPLAVPPS